MRYSSRQVPVSFVHQSSDDSEKYGLPANCDGISFVSERQRKQAVSTVETQQGKRKNKLLLRTHPEVGDIDHNLV